MLELFLLGCTGVVVFLHGANFFFHSLSRQIAVRPLRLFNLVSVGNIFPSAFGLLFLESFLGFVGW